MSKYGNINFSAGNIIDALNIVSSDKSIQHDGSSGGSNSDISD